MAALGLDQVWWLVSPQNPLKPARGMAPFGDRFALARLMARHPGILVTDLETQLGTRFTADTLAALRRYYPRTHFVWLMGADNLGQIHRWQRWRSIFDTVPVAVFDRPAFSLRTLNSPAALAYGAARRDPRAARDLSACTPPAWVFFPSRLEPLSSTHLRRIAQRFGPDALHGGAAMPSLKKAGPRMVSPSATIQPGTIQIATRKKATPSPDEAPSPTASAPGSNPPELALESLADAIRQSIDDDKGEDIVVIDLRDKSNIADFIVIATGRSSRQVGAMADHIVQRLQPRLSYRMAVEGLPQGDWVLIDSGDVVVHLFRPEVRNFYAIEKMWGLEPPLLSASETPMSGPDLT
jgi:nicotinate-nucleotide adenylyltransferase